MGLPLTRGLLASMAKRCRHDFDAPRLPEIPMFSFGFTPPERSELLIEMHELYLRFANGYEPAQDCGGESGSDFQIWEEYAGKGFYSPGREDEYAAMWPKDFNPDWWPVAPPAPSAP